MWIPQRLSTVLTRRNTLRITLTNLAIRGRSFLGKPRRSRTFSNLSKRSMILLNLGKISSNPKLTIFLSPECCIISLVYMNRMINFYSLTLQTTNWRPLILVALLVAQKVWDDRYLCTADFVTIYPFFSVDELIKLELKFLELIEYNV